MPRITLRQYDDNMAFWPRCSKGIFVEFQRRQFFGSRWAVILAQEYIRRARTTINITTSVSTRRVSATIAQRYHIRLQYLPGTSALLRVVDLSFTCEQDITIETRYTDSLCFVFMKIHCFCGFRNPTVTRSRRQRGKLNCRFSLDCGSLTLNSGQFWSQTQFRPVLCQSRLYTTRSVNHRKRTSVHLFASMCAFFFFFFCMAQLWSSV